MSIFRYAEENEENLDQQFQNLIASIPAEEQSALIQASSYICDKGRISINLKPSAMEGFIKKNRYYNMYEIAKEIATRESRDQDEVLKERLGRFYEKRKKFETHSGHPDVLWYGALNIGGLGCDHYGYYCIILKREVLNIGKFTYLKEDSLCSKYWNGNNLILDAIKGDLATITKCGQLACLKHINIIQYASEEWQNIILGTNHFIESIFSAEITLETLDKVRIPKAKFDRFFDDAVFGNINSEERFETLKFHTIYHALIENEINIEVISND